METRPPPGAPPPRKPACTVQEEEEGILAYACGLVRQGELSTARRALTAAALAHGDAAASDAPEAVAAATPGTGTEDSVGDTASGSVASKRTFPCTSSCTWR